jgi:transposase
LPDLNPIKQIWKYICKEIRKRRYIGIYPQNEKEIWAAWEEEWTKVP